LKKIFSEVDHINDVTEVIMSPEFDIALNKCVYSNYAEIRLHRHDYIEIAYVSNGKGIHVQNDRSFKVSKGNIFITNNDDIHSFFPYDTRNSGKLAVYNCILRSSLLDTIDIKDVDYINVKNFLSCESTMSINEAMYRYKLSGSLLNQVESILVMMFMEFNMNMLAGKFNLILLLYQLLTCMYRIFIYGRQEQVTYNINKLDFVNEVINYLKANYSSRITLDDIAKHTLLSKNYLITIFREIMNTTIFNYLTDVRIERACEMLAMPEQKIGNVSACVGYNDNSYFVKVFKNVMGITPSEYRDNALKGSLASAGAGDGNNV